MDRLGEIEVFWEWHWQKTVSLNTQSGEKARIADGAQQQRNWNPVLIGLAQNVSQQVKESHVWLRRPRIVAHNFDFQFVTDDSS